MTLKNTEIIYSSRTLILSSLSLNYLLPVFKNKTSKTGFVLSERKRGFEVFARFFFPPL